MITIKMEFSFNLQIAEALRNKFRLQMIAMKQVNSKTHQSPRNVE